MRIIKRMFLINLFLCCTSILSPLTAITDQKLAVEIIYNGKDTLGSRLLYKIKEGIRNSSSLRLSYTKEQKIKVHLMTMQIDSINLKGQQEISIFGISITYWNGKSEYYLTSQLGCWSSENTSEIAESIIAGIDKEADSFKRAVYN